MNAIAEILESIAVGDVVLSAIRGDITSEKVDAVVNAANSYLAHGGGVAGAIARKGGHEIIQESREWIACNGPVPVGEAIVTTGGKLFAKYIIHTVGPRWGEGDEDEKLRNAVKSALQRAVELECATVSLPAISTGIFGFPKRLGVKTIVRAALEFAQNPGSVRQIRFCSIDDATAMIFGQELQKRL